MLVRFRARKHLERHPVIRIDPHLIARFQCRCCKIGRALQNDRLRSVLGTDAQSIFADHFGDFRDRSGRFKTEIANDDERFVDEHARSLFQFRQRNPWIDITIVIGAANDNVRSVFGCRAKKSTDPIRGRSYFFDDFLELLDHLPRLANHLRLVRHVRPQIEQVVPDRIARRKRSDQAIQFVEQRKIRRWLVETFQLSAALVAHRKTQSMPESNAIITFSLQLRNPSSRKLSEFDAAWAQNVQPSAAPKVPNSNAQAPKNLQFPNFSTARVEAVHLQYWCLELLWGLGFDTWDFL